MYSLSIFPERSFRQAEPPREDGFHKVLLTSYHDGDTDRRGSGRTSWNVDLKLCRSSNLCT